MNRAVRCDVPSPLARGNCPQGSWCFWLAAPLPPWTLPPPGTPRLPSFLLIPKDPSSPLCPALHPGHTRVPRDLSKPSPRATGVTGLPPLPGSSVQNPSHPPPTRSVTLDKTRASLSDSFLTCKMGIAVLRSEARYGYTEKAKPEAESRLAVVRAGGGRHGEWLLHGSGFLFG